MQSKRFSTVAVFTTYKANSLIIELEEQDKGESTSLLIAYSAVECREFTFQDRGEIKKDILRGRTLNQGLSSIVC